MDLGTTLSGEDNTGNIWIGTEDAGVNKLDAKTGKLTHFEPTGNPESISYYNIHGFGRKR